MFPFPPIAPGFVDPFWPSVVMLTSMAGSNGSTTFTDESSYARSVGTSGNAKVSNAQTLFGQNTGLFDGSGDYLAASNNSLLSVANSTDKTIEAWIRVTTGSRINTIANKRSISSAHEFNFAVNSTNKMLFAAYASGSSVATITGSATISTGVWYHVAAVRIGGVWTLYVDGAVDGTATQSATPSSSADALFIGRDNFNTARDFLGHLAEFRYTNAARYTAAFTRPSTAFPRG